MIPDRRSEYRRRLCILLCCAVLCTSRLVNLVHSKSRTLFGVSQSLQTVRDHFVCSNTTIVVAQHLLLPPHVTHHWQ